MVIECFTHPSKTLQKLNEQRLSSEFTDVTVLVAGQHFSVHKSLLAAHSSVFYSVLQDASLNQGTPNINLDGVEPEYFSVIIDFVYTSKLMATPKNVDQLHATAMFLQMQEVIDLCNQFKKSHKEASNHSEVAEKFKPNTIVTEDNEMSQLVVDITKEPQQDDKVDVSLLQAKQAKNMMVEVFGSEEPGYDEEEGSKSHQGQNGDTEEKKKKQRGRKRQSRVTCEVCSKVMTRTKYEIHKRIHTGEKPYQCIVCQKQFASIYNQRIHERIHTGERPFHCNICNKTFSDPSTTRKHRLWHEGIKTKQCGMCGKRFSSMTQVRDHMRSHTKEKPYVCTECGKAYGYRCDLKRHMREHTGNLIGPCNECGKFFNHRGNFLSHLKTHEPKKTNPPQLRLQDSGLVTPDGRIILKAKICGSTDPLGSTMLMVPAHDQGEGGHDVTNHHGNQDNEVLKVHDLTQQSDGEIEVTINNRKFYMKQATLDQGETILNSDQILMKEDDIEVATTTSVSTSQTRLFDQQCETSLSPDQVLMFVQHSENLDIASSSLHDTDKNDVTPTDDIILTSENAKPFVIVDQEMD